MCRRRRRLLLPSVSGMICTLVSSARRADVLEHVCPSLNDTCASIARVARRQSAVEMKATMSKIAWLLSFTLLLLLKGSAVATNPLVLIVFDGFRSDYLSTYPTPHLDKIAAEGVVVPALIPEFPASR